MAAPSLRSLGTVVASSTSSPSFAAPAGAVSTDVIIIAFNTDDGRTTITGVPSGFTAAANSPQINDPTLGSPSHRLDVYWGRFSDVGSGPYGFTTSGASFVEGRSAAIQGCITTGNPFEATSGATSGNTNVTTAPSVSATSTDVDRYAFYTATNWTGGAWTPATGFVEQWDANDQIITIDDKTLSTAQTVTPQAVNASSSRMNAWVGILLPIPAASIPPPPTRTVQSRDPGEAWWLQRDRRDANTVATAANPLPSPLDSAWQAGGRYWHLYADAADAATRTWMAQQRTYSDPSLLAPAAAMPPWAPIRTVQARDYGEAQWLQPAHRDPLLLTTALLENELLGGADTAKRYLEPATHAPRWWMPQQPRRDGYTPGLLDSALLEGPLLAGDIRRHVSAAAYVDRREVPQQRAYISDPSFYPTVAPTDPLTLAYGAGGTYWLLYNVAALTVDRREVPQQRRYQSDPSLLGTALLEDALLGGATTVQRLTWFTDRREVPAQRVYTDVSLLAAPDVDPTTLAAGVGGDLWRRANTSVYIDRRETAAQPPRRTLYFDAGPGLPPLTLAWGAGGNLWHVYNPRRPARSWWPQGSVFAIQCSCTTARPSTGTTGRPGSGITIRPNTGITEDPCC